MAGETFVWAGEAGLPASAMISGAREQFQFPDVIRTYPGDTTATRKIAMDGMIVLLTVTARTQHGIDGLVRRGAKLFGEIVAAVRVLDDEVAPAAEQLVDRTCRRGAPVAPSLTYTSFLPTSWKPSLS